MNMQIEFTSDEDAPVKVVVDIPVDEKAMQQQNELNYEEMQSENNSRGSEGSAKECSIYDDCVLFIEPMFIIDPRNFTCMSIKIQLRRLIRCVPNQCRVMMSLLNRSRNR